MCDFFSLCSIKGKLFYFNWEQRQKILKGELKLISNQTVKEADSHSEIAAYYQINPDKANHYEYDFFKKELVKDRINLKDDFETVLIQCKKLKVSTIAPLNIKKIINPFEIRRYKIGLKEAIKLLKKWASVGPSVWASVRASVRDSVGPSVGASVRDSVGASVWDLVGVLVRDSVWAYISSFFNISYKYDFSPCVQLWESGYVPSFDGTVWRLHGHKGKVVYKYKPRAKKK